MTSVLGEFLGGNFKQQKSRTETQGLEPGSISSYFVFADYGFRIRVTKILIEKQDLGTAFILGHPTNGILGTSELGEGTLGTYSTEEEVILNQTIPTIAREEIAKWLASETSTAPTHLALGVDGTAYSEANTELGDEVYRASISNYDTTTDKTAEYQIEILSTDTDSYGFVEDFSTDTYLDSDNTTADWGGF
jgi:hypothetical protein